MTSTWHDEYPIIWEDVEHFLAEAAEKSKGISPDVLEIMYRWELEPWQSAFRYRTGRWVNIASLLGEGPPPTNWEEELCVFYMEKFPEIAEFADAIDVVGNLLNCLANLDEQSDLLSRYEEKYGHKENFESRSFWERHFSLQPLSASCDRHIKKLFIRLRDLP